MPAPAVPTAALEQYPVQRRWDRVPLSMHIRVHRKVDGAIETTDGQAQDLSIGGIGAYIPNTYAVNDKVTVEFILPFGQKPIQFEAEVRDANGFRYGFEFLRVKEDEREQLRESIAAFAVKKSS
jgi:c-di-GMP-binding flagellar brake protein YcgR